MEKTNKGIVAKAVIASLLLTILIGSIISLEENNNVYANDNTDTAREIPFDIPFDISIVKKLVDMELERVKEIETAREERKQEMLDEMLKTMETIKEKAKEEALMVESNTKQATREVKPSVTRGGGRSVSNIFTITAYDLSVQSCGKKMNHPAYGITASGASIKGMSREEAMVVAADTRIIPMGSKVRLEFVDERYAKYNGVYTVKDRGGAIKGAKLDLFMGDFNKETTDQSVWDFGVAQAKVYLIIE